MGWRTSRGGLRLLGDGRHVLALCRDCTSSRATPATRYGVNPSSVSTRGTLASTDLFGRPEPFRAS